MKKINTVSYLCHICRVLCDSVTLSHLAQIDDLVDGLQRIGEGYILPQDKLENKERIPRVA